MSKPILAYKKGSPLVAAFFAVV